MSLTHLYGLVMVSSSFSLSELIQTEMHHVRTLKIMADVYSKGLLREVQLESQTVEKMFPMLDEVLDLHTQFFSHLLERKKESGSQEEGGIVIRKIGDVLVSQVTSGSNLFWSIYRNALICNVWGV